MPIKESAKEPTRRPTKRDDLTDINDIRARIDGGFRITLQQLCVAHQVGLTTIYKDIHSGRLIVQKEGRRTFVEAIVAQAYLRGDDMPKGMKGDDISSPSNVGRAGAAAFKTQQGEARMARVEALAREIEAELTEGRAV